MTTYFKKNTQYYKFCLYGFLKNLRFFDAFIILFFRENGLTFFQIGALYSFREIIIQIFEIPSGIIADSWGRRKAMILALAAYIVSFILFYNSDTFHFFLSAMFLFAIGEAFRSGTHKAMIVDYLNQNSWQNHKSQYYGQTRSWSQMGSALAALGGMAIVFGSGIYKTIFLVSVIPYLINLVLIWTYPKELDGKVNNKSHKKPLENFKNTFHDTKLAFQKTSLIRSIFSSSLFIAIFKSEKDYIQPMIKSMVIASPLLLSFTGFADVQKEALFIGGIYFFIFILTSLSSRNAYRFENRLKSLSRPVNAIYLFTAFTIILSGILFYLDYNSYAIIIFLGLFIAQNLRRPLMLSYLSEKIPVNILATGLSVESQLKTVIIAMLSPLLGWIIDVYSLGGGIFVGGFFMLLFYPVTKLVNKTNSLPNR